jgi:type VI protein secretion system component VasF
MPDPNPDQGVIDFLTEQLKRQEDERIRLNDQLVRVHGRNLATLVSTWRFIIVTRVAVLVIGLAGLQLIMLNADAFLDASALVPVLEKYFGRESGIVANINLWSPQQAGLLVVIVIIGIALLTLTMDGLLVLLQTRCRARGLEAERYLRIEALFFEIYMRRKWIELPFWIARAVFLVFVIVALGYLGIALKEI